METQKEDTYDGENISGCCQKIPASRPVRAHSQTKRYKNQSKEVRIGRKPAHGWYLLYYSRAIINPLSRRVQLQPVLLSSSVSVLQERRVLLLP